MAQISDELVREITNKIVADLRPEQVFLFGSRAWGTPDEGSDIDLFVVVSNSDQPPYRRARRAYRAIRGIKAPVEIVVQTRSEVESASRVASSLVHKVLAQGKLMYG